VAAEGDGVIVSFDYARRLKAPLPAPISEAIRQIEGLSQ
jgi:hypothetical protein